MIPFLRGLLWPFCLVGLHRWRVRAWLMVTGRREYRCEVCGRSCIRFVKTGTKP
jgi:hypothetical protein